jgi:hypothetical protein
MRDDQGEEIVFGNAIWVMIFTSSLACIVTMLGIMIISWSEERRMGNAACFWVLYLFDRSLNSLDQQSVYGRLAIDSHVVFSLPYVSSYLDNHLPQ